ncbi:hypothetical protein QC761_0113590 [Podospora bellae-mahoneyi]|uniref:J domain-containing protein n=1 Tax=Podospora bellae-mahoneyi TaxID=2093777 RepID=A0ABR0F7E8_9PEZI|nr:hypothetical protein QC761_0113590 [Podospora bellae-mahoneyi]
MSRAAVPVVDLRYYSTLEIKLSATREEIKKSYRRLALLGTRTSAQPLTLISTTPMRSFLMIPREPNMINRSTVAYSKSRAQAEWNRQVVLIPVKTARSDNGLCGVLEIN